MPSNDVMSDAIANDDAAWEANPPETRTVNVPLLRKTLEHITAHPEEWNQETWATQTACGTAACVAGWAVTFAGHKLLWSDPDDDVCDCESCTRWRPPQASQCVVDGQVRTIHEAAQDALGLNSLEATRLFRGSNGLPYLWNFANEITNGEIEIPADIGSDVVG